MANAVDISIGESFSDHIDPADKDFYRVNLVSGNYYTVELEDFQGDIDWLYTIPGIRFHAQADPSTGLEIDRTVSWNQR